MNPLASAIEACVRGLAALGSLCAFAIFVCMTVDIVGREVFHLSTDYAVDASELLMVPLVFLVLPYVAQVGANVKVDVLINKVGPGLRVTLDRLSHLLFLPFAGIIGWCGWRAVYDAYRFGSVTDAGIPIWPALVAIPVGSALLCIQVTVLVGHGLFGRRADPAPPGS